MMVPSSRAGRLVNNSAGAIGWPSSLSALALFPDWQWLIMEVE